MIELNPSQTKMISAAAAGNASYASEMQRMKERDYRLKGTVVGAVTGCFAGGVAIGVFQVAMPIILVANPVVGFFAGAYAGYKLAPLLA